MAKELWGLQFGKVDSAHNPKGSGRHDSWQSLAAILGVDLLLTLIFVGKNPKEPGKEASGFGGM